MKLSVLMAIKSVICLVVGLALVLIPDQVATLTSTTLNAGTTSMARLFGALFLLVAVLLWMIKSVEHVETRRDIVLAVFVGDAIGFVVALLSQLQEPVSQLGWVTVVVYLLLALAFGYFVFFRPVTTVQTADHPAHS